MSAFALVGLLFLAGVEVAIAPDQPLPMGYMDDPVILELRSEVDGTARVEVRVQSRGQDEPATLTLDTLPLHAGGSRWESLDDFPAVRGFYTADVTVELGGGDAARERLHFCRIDRPLGDSVLPVCAWREDAWDEPCLLALRNAGVRHLRIDLGAADAGAQMALARALHFRIVPHLTLADPARLGETIAQATGAHADYCPDVAWWEVASGAGTEGVAEVAEALHRSGCPAPVVFIAHALDQVNGLVSSGLIAHVDGLALDELDRASGEAVRRTLASGGFEHLAVHCGLPAPAPERPAEGPALARALLAGLAAGATYVTLDARLVYDGTVQEPLPSLAGLARRLRPAVCVGSLAAEKGAQAPLFRANGAWLAAAWTDGPRKAVEVWVEGAADLVLTDVLNNPLPLPEIADGKLLLTAGPEPVLLSGSGGRAAAPAARATAAATAAALLSDAALAEARYPYLDRLLERARDQLNEDGLFAGKSDDGETGLRAVLLDMLREFPRLEYRWQSGEAPREATLVVAAELARLTRALCAVEDARGHPFIEPLGDRLANCEAHQSVYLTSQTGDSPFAARGDQLLAEVRRLMDEARRLDEAGYGIEAHGVAALAEWRARALNALEEGAPMAPPPPEPVTPEPAAPDAPEAAPEAPDPEEEALEPGQPAGTRKVVHEVSRGDNPSAIAKKYGVALDDFMKWNKLTSRSILSIGQKLTVYVKRDNP